MLFNTLFAYVMSDTNLKLKTVAQEMTKEEHIDELKKELSIEGAYHVLIEGGYHQQTLTDDEADLLTTLLVDHGISGLLSLAKVSDSREDIALITPLIDKSESQFQELIRRLDDGNEYPGLFMDYNTDLNKYTVYSEGN